jgi:hypothetical protein
MLLNEKGEKIEAPSELVKNQDGKEQGLDLAEVKTIKASERTRAHLNSPGAIHRTFGSEEEMVESAMSTYNTEKDKEHEADKEKGFDFSSIESVTNFKVGYTPAGNSVLVKVISEERKSGLIFLPSGSGDTIKAVVVVPGLYVNNLKPGDVISFKKAPPATPNGKPQNILPPMQELTLRDIKFKDVSYEAIAGIFLEREEIIARVAEENKKLGYKQD